MADSLLGKLRKAIQGAFLSHVPDHPAHGGNTGDTEWPREENEDEEKQTEDGETETEQD